MDVIAGAMKAAQERVDEVLGDLVAGAGSMPNDQRHTTPADRTWDQSAMAV